MQVDPTEQVDSAGPEVAGRYDDVAAAVPVTRLDGGPDRRRTVGRIVADRAEVGYVVPPITKARWTDPAQDRVDLGIRGRTAGGGRGGASADNR